MSRSSLPAAQRKLRRWFLVRNPVRPIAPPRVVFPKWRIPKTPNTNTTQTRAGVLGRLFRLQRHAVGEDKNVWEIPTSSLSTQGFGLTPCSYGPYVLPFPVASAIPWPVLHGTHPDLTSRIPPVVTLTSLLIWNGPTIAAMVSTSFGGQSRSIHTIPEALPSSGSSSANSLSPRQGLDTFLRTHSWVNSPDRPLLLPVVSPRTRSAADDASCYVSRSNSERSISLSDVLPSSWAGHAHATSRNTDLTLVETGLMMSDYSTSLRSHRHGFYGRRHGSIRSMSPVYMEG